MRTELRNATQSSHQRLDGIVSRLKPFATQAGYEVYLSAMYQLYAIYGEPLDRASRWAEISESSRTLRDAIVEDIGREPDIWRQGKSSAWADHEVWAVAYVLEGSAMGARYMVNEIRNGDFQFSHRYLSKLAEDSYERWPKFVDCLELAGCELAPTVEAAKDVFETAEQCFLRESNGVF